MFFSDFSELTSGEKDKCVGGKLAGGLYANAFPFFGISYLMNLRGNLLFVPEFFFMTVPPTIFWCAGPMVLVFTIISGVGLISSPQSPPPGNPYGPLAHKPPLRAQNMKLGPESNSCLQFSCKRCCCEKLSHWAAISLVRQYRL